VSWGLFLLGVLVVVDAVEKFYFETHRFVLAINDGLGFV
jgi:hypothetical protein